MSEFDIIGMENLNSPEQNLGSTETGKSELPVQVSMWTKFKNFLLQDVEQMELMMTPGEKKFVDFWAQPVTIDDVYDFMFKPIKFK